MIDLAPTAADRASDGAAARSLARLPELPPTWARAWVGACDPVRRSSGDVELTVARGPRAALITAVVRGARGCRAGEEFRRLAHEVYTRVRASLGESSAAHVVRMWNHIPGIHDPLDDECDRYMHFNAGRFAAMCEWFGGADRFPASVPAASGVGDEGQDLVVHAFATVEPGVPVENPQQVPAFRYSRRYGPLPPCFARATRVAAPFPALLIAGTAAITGEQSQHPDDLPRQLELTLENLRVLIRAGAPALDESTDPLCRMEHVRVYVKRDAHMPAVDRAVHCAFSPTSTEALELLRADLCRAELLVEIEGVARLDGAAPQ